MVDRGQGLVVDMVDVEEMVNGRRFQNYRARFTVLDLPKVPRVWLNDLIGGRGSLTDAAPQVWREWVELGKAQPLRAKRSI